MQSQNVSSDNTIAIRLTKQQEYKRRYYEIHKQVLLQQHREYKAKNLDRIRARALRKEPCPLCSSMGCHDNMSRHQKTNKCKRLTEQKKRIQENNAYIQSKIILPYNIQDSNEYR